MTKTKKYRCTVEVPVMLRFEADVEVPEDLDVGDCEGEDGEDVEKFLDLAEHTIARELPLQPLREGLGVIEGPGKNPLVTWTTDSPEYDFEVSSWYAIEEGDDDTES